MYMFRRFTGFACILGCLFCMLATTQLITLATEIVPVTDTWIPLDDAWDTVAPLYDNYNTALSENSGVTITADNYKEYVIKSIIGNMVATHNAFGEDVSLDGLIEVIMADADLVNALGSATLVNPLNGAYYLGEAMGASLRASIDEFLETTFGLTDIMTTSEAVGKDFPYGRVFVKADTTDTSYYTYNNWLYVPNGNTWFPNTNGAGIRCDMPDGLWIAYGESTYSMFIGTFITSSSQATDDVVWGCYYANGFGYYTWDGLKPWSVWNNGGYLYRASSARLNGDAGNGMRQIFNSLGLVPFASSDVAFNALYGSGTPAPETTYTDPIVVINDNEPPIISPTSVYNDWSTISNNNYNTYNTDYVTYNTGDSIYNYTYYYTINNYSNDMPLWVVNGKNLPVYEFERETFYDFSNTNYTVSDDLVWDSSFFDFVWQNLPAELVGLLLTMLIASAFFLLFRH